MLFKRYKEGKSDVPMCKILKEIQGKSPEQLLDKYNISIEPPIDLDSLAFNIGIELIPQDFSEIEKEVDLERGTILGAAISNGDNLGIFYRETDSENRIRFTIAHEIAHCCLHTNNLISDHIELRGLVEDDREREANIFAGALLIPEESLYEIYEQLMRPSLDVLSQIFKVSSNVMSARLKYLGLNYYKEKNISEV